MLDFPYSTCAVRIFTCGMEVLVVLWIWFRQRQNIKLLGEWLLLRVSSSAELQCTCGFLSTHYVQACSGRKQALGLSPSITGTSSPRMNTWELNVDHLPLWHRSLPPASLGWTEGGIKRLLLVILMWKTAIIHWDSISRLKICWLHYLIKGCPLWLLLKLSWCFRRWKEVWCRLHSGLGYWGKSCPCLIPPLHQLWVLALSCSGPCCLLPPPSCLQVLSLLPGGHHPSWRLLESTSPSHVCHTCVCGQHALVEGRESLLGLVTFIMPF